MKSISKLSWLFLLIGLSLVSCRDDKDVTVDPPTTIEINPPKINVSASVFGLVKDQSGNAIADAKVSIDGKTITQTDRDGAFISSSITLNQLGSNIVVEKSGYFIGSKFVQPRDGRSVYSEMTLVTRSLTATIDATTGGIVTINGGATVQLSAQGIEDAQGNIYTGSVNVYAHWYDPSRAELVDEMPGDLRAVSSANQFQQLATYGMMAVELESANGSPLNIAEGTTAALSFPVPSTIDGAAPERIPLWFFDEASGYWLEDGVATKIASTYSAEVSHFTWWNCDVPNDFIELSGTITDANNNSFQWANIKFTDSGALNGYTWTGFDGFYSLKVPKNDVLLMEIYDQCQILVHSLNIGPFAADDIQDVQLPVSSSATIQITATLLECTSGLPVSEGYLKLEVGSEYYLASVDANGVASWNYSNCSNATSITATGVDYTNNLFSLPITMAITPNNIVDFGTIMACEINPEYLNLDGDGILGSCTEMNLQSPSSNGQAFTFWGSGLDSTYVQMNIWQDSTGFPTIGVGTFTPTSMGFDIPNGPGNWVSAFCNPCDDITLTIDTFGNVGEKVVGSWTGTNYINGTPVQTNGNFSIYREN